MLPIPPISTAAYAAAAVGRQAEEKIQQLQRAQDRAKDSTAPTDRYEHSVESSEEVQPIRDEDEQAKQNKKKQQSRRQAYQHELADDNGETHLDVTA